MKIKFCGAAQFVTGSSHLITLDNGYKILLDCGLFQGKGKYIWDWNNEWLFDPAEIDCVILSHAHIDHSGRIPKLVQDGFKGSIYSTHATRSLCSIMLMDSAFIQERDVSYYNNRLKKKKKSVKPLRVPLYSVDIVPQTMSQFVTTGYERWTRVSEDVEVLFREAGHILGSASVTLRINDGGKKRVVGFTGDVGRPDRPILKDPVQMEPVDYLISESTYGAKLHEDKPAQEKKLLEVIRRACVEEKGKLIIPAFSVGRTQEIVYMMDRLSNQDLLPKIPIYVDSPLSVNATNIFIQHPECFDKDLIDYMSKDPNPFGFNHLNYIKDVTQSKRLNEKKGPMVIISASGMMNAGRVKHHLSNNIEKSNSTVLIVGYCSPETPGGQLRAGAEELTLFGMKKKVNAHIEQMDSFSAHADQRELTNFLDNQKGSVKKLFLVHGEPESQEIFREHLSNEGHKDIVIPAKEEEFDLT